MAPHPPRVVLAPQPQHTLVHDGPPRGRAKREKDAARVAHGQLFVFLPRANRDGVGGATKRGVSGFSAKSWREMLLLL